MVYTTKPPFGTQLDLTKSINKGLAAFWLLNEGSGNKAYDLSGNGNTGTLFNTDLSSTSGWVPGRLGPSVALDGIDDYIEADQQLILNYPFSISSWVLANPIGMSDYVIFGLTDKNIEHTQYGMLVGIDELGRVMIRAQNKGVASDAYSLSSSRIDNNNWYHVVAIYESATQRRLYVNNILQLTSTTSITYDTNVNRWSIGRWGDITPKSYFKGIIDEVRVFNRILTNTEISTLYNNPYEMFLETSSPIVISNITAASGLTYVQQDMFAVGSFFYIDRTYTVASVPTSYLGLKHIETANDDRYRTESTFLQFDINTSTTIYVAYDDRAYPRPSWLTASFVDTGDNIIRNDGNVFSIYARNYPAGHIYLGGTAISTTGLGGSYIVLIRSRTIKVTSPVGGEVWTRGGSYPITWTGGNSAATVRIATYRSGIISTSLTTDTANDGYWLYVTSASSTNVGTDFKIRVTDNSDETYGESANFFTFVSSIKCPIPECRITIS